MRKVFYLLSATCITLTLFTGCSAHKEEMADPVDSMSPAMEVESTAEILSEEPETPEYTIAEICAGFRENWDEWRKLYDSPDIFWVTVDDKDYYYRHTYPSNEWTVDEVAEYYHEHYYYWGDDPEMPYGEVTRSYLWTPDYEHKFMADTADHWLYIDGIKAAPLEVESYSMNPKDLVEAFQSREWDGKTRRYSDDFSTYVTVVPQYGILDYRFHTEYLSESEDPAGLAYTGYLDAIPWWENEANVFDVVSMYSSVHTGDRGGLNTPFTYGYRRVDESGESGGRSSNIWAITYVDVPWDQQSRLWSVRTAGETYPDSPYAGENAMHALYAGRTADGLYCVVDGGVELWRAGRLRQTWDLKMTSDCYLSTDQYYSDSIVVYTDGKLYELYDDGEAGLILDHIVSVNLRYAYTFCGFTLSEDGTLQICGKCGDNDMISAEIATDIVEADLSDEYFVLYTDSSGKTYAIYDFLGSDAGMVALCYQEDYKVVCIGEGSIEDFKELYETYEREHEGRYLQKQFIEETSMAYLATSMEDQPVQP